jgi:hypothetical protein
MAIDIDLPRCRSCESFRMIQSPVKPDLRFYLRFCRSFRNSRRSIRAQSPNSDLFNAPLAQLVEQVTLNAASHQGKPRRYRFIRYLTTERSPLLNRNEVATSLLRITSATTRDSISSSILAQILAQLGKSSAQATIETTPDAPDLHSGVELFGRLEESRIFVYSIRPKSNSHAVGALFTHMPNPWACGYIAQIAFSEASC